MKMKARILALLFLFVGVNSIYGQTSEKYLYKILQSDKERMCGNNVFDSSVKQNECHQKTEE